MSHKVTANVGGAEIHIESGKIAKQADGAVTVQLGETIVLVAACGDTKPRPGLDFFPLTVDYREKAAAAGRFPGGFFKREGRPSEKEILTCRVTDRPIRPLFPKGYFNEVQIQTLLLSADGDNDSDVLSINGASAALMISDLPFAGPALQLEGVLVDHAHARGAGRVPERLEATVGVHRQLAAELEGAAGDEILRFALLAEAEILVGEHLGEREAVVQLDDVELYDYAVVNDDAERAGAELESILTAERARVDARRDVIRRLLDRGSL